MRFDRNAVCRDSRRKTAIRLQKKRAQPETEETDDVQPFRRVQFANPTDIRKRPKQRRFHMAVIAESRPSSALSHISTLYGSPYRRSSLITVSFIRLLRCTPSFFCYSPPRRLSLLLSMKVHQITWGRIRIFRSTISNLSRTHPLFY